MRNQKIVIIFLIAIYRIVAFAQTPGDTSKWLQEINISGEKISHTEQTARVESLDTSDFAKLLNPTIADQLNREGDLFIKSYGAGSLASVSIRGTGAAHTTLLWNGIQICSPMLGIYDLTLMPSFLLDDVKIQYGGNGAVAGNGAIGGAIRMNSTAGTKQGVGVKLLSTIGSFGFFEEGVSLQLAKEKLYTTTRFYTKKAENDYNYTDPEGNSSTLTNCNYKQMALSHDLRYGSATNNLNVHLWYLANERKIPPSMLASSSLQEQEDESFRVALEWNRILKKLRWNIRSGWSSEYLQFIDPNASLNDKSNANTFQADGSVSSTPHNGWYYGTQFSWIYSEAKASGYKQWQHLNQWSQNFQVNYSNIHFEFYAAAKYGLYNTKALPLIPSMGLLYKFTNSTGIRFNIASVYRVPTLNDLYWQPGGNPDLLPEHGYNGAISLLTAWQHDAFKLTFEGGMYNSRLKDVLVWLPADDGVYHAYNIQEIWSRGLEGKLNLTWQKKNWHFSAILSPQYNLSTIEKTSPQFGSSIGKQLIYSPQVLLKSQFEVRFKNWSMHYDQGYTGYRYVTADESQWLDPYSVADLSFSWAKQIGAYELTTMFAIKNIWDESYQVIAWRAMPGVNYQAGILLRFN